MAMNYRQLERIVRGFSNHRRIQMLELLQAQPDLDLMGISSQCGTDFRNASVHLRRLATAGLVLKRAKGNRVLHALSPRGRAALKFLRTVE